jgi:transposase InsO family protein
MTTEQKVIRAKLGLLALAKQLGNVSQACQVRGVSRDTFYRDKDLDETGGAEALKEITRRKPNLRNRIAPAIAQRVVAVGIEQPAWGQLRLANELATQGVRVSPAGVRCIWQRHDLETMPKRVAARAARAAQDGRVLTEGQVAALERAQHERQVHGEFESECPGYCGAQDTYYVGTIKGVGRIYQQTFIDTYAKVADAKLYTEKTPITAADLLNDRVLPFYAAHGIPRVRMLTDRGTEFCGTPDRHPYELYLAVEDIEHTRTTTRRSQTHGICERFHKTVLNEFYRTTFRKTIYRSVETLQADLDVWLAAYNHERPHQGRWCYGKTPMQTFVATLPVAQEKLIASGRSE